MVALDNTALFGEARTGLRHRISLPLVGGIALMAATLVVGAWAVRGFGENGFRLGSLLAWRFTAIVFFLAVAAGPACRIGGRLFAVDCPQGLSGKLVWGFCAGYGVYLVSIFLPNVIRLSAGATLMVAFGGAVALVMALTIAPLHSQSGRPLIGDKTRRVLLGTAAIYFWACYALMALSRLIGPHRPDAFYGISLLLMLAALGLRFADRLAARHDDAKQAQAAAR